MNDQRLLALARMAAEVDQLEQSAAAPIRLAPAASSARPRTGSRLTVLGPLAAMAACAALAAAIVLWPSGGAGGGPSRNTGLIATKPPQPDPSTVVQPRILPVKESSIVLAIVEDTDGGVQCVRWTAHDSRGTPHEGLDPADLARAICRADCVPGPHWLLAARVSGPTSMMPSRDDEVQALAACIIDQQSSERCDGGPTVFSPTPGTAQCIPAGVRVVVERRSMSGRASP